MEPKIDNTVYASAVLSDYFLDAWGIKGDTLLETNIVSPKSLLSPNRFDLACKLYYIDCIEKGSDMTFAKELYRAHIEAFSDGTFIEPGLVTKNSIQDYYETFEKLIADIRKHGFDPEKSVVPVGDNEVILDGSHRVAIAIYYDIPLTIVRIPGQRKKYDQEFFRRKNLRTEYLDFMAFQFIHFSERIYTVCLWPAAYDAKKLAEADRLIRNNASVIYQKEALLNYCGIEKLMISFYKSMEWTGSIENGFRGVASKTKECYKTNSPTIIYIIGGMDLNGVVKLKQYIRDLYAIENSSIHITDTHLEAEDAGKLLLFKNSIDFLNYGNPFNDKRFIKEFARRAEGYEPCSSNDVTLKLYCLGECYSFEECKTGDAFQDPEDYFYFWGVKLPSLEFVKNAKRNDGSQDDLKIVRRIEEFERKKRGIRAETKERAALAVQKTSRTLSRSFKGFYSDAKRRVRIVYHRIKYRDQSWGKCEKNIEDLRAAFMDINTTTAEYLIMRNWEGFFDDILLEGHNDIDILCRDKDSRDIIVRLLDAKPLTFDGFHFCIKYKGNEVTLDTRIVGDGYYDRSWEKKMLKQKRMHPLGFYVMGAEDYYFSLIYHAIYQKRAGLSKEYAQRLNQMSLEKDELTQKEFANQLDSFMRRNRYSYTTTMDKSVVNAFSNTAIPKEVRYPLNIIMHHKIEAIKGKHLLQRLKIRLRKLIKRG